MADGGRGGPTRGPISPFAFPSDTTLRFILLVILVLGTSSFIGYWAYTSVPSYARDLLNGYNRCFASVASIADQFDRAAAFGRCRTRVNAPIGAWVVGAPLLVAGAATGLFLVWPSARIRRRRLEPLDGDLASAVAPSLRAMFEMAGLRRPPTVLWNPASVTTQALAFGRPGRRYVGLSGGAMAQSFIDPPAFRSTMLHELAHLRNRDVTLAYATEALWRSFVVLALLPFLVLLAWKSRDHLDDFAVRMIALAIVVALIRNAVLRSREHFADVRGAAWDGPEGAFTRVLTALPRSRRSPRWFPWSVHPDPQRRLAVVADPTPLSAARTWDALGVGIVAAVVSQLWITVVSLFRSGTETSRLAAIPAAMLIVGTVGVAVWRESTLAWPPARSMRLFVGPAFAVGGGFTVGLLLSLGSTVGGVSEGPVSRWLAFDLLWTLALSVGVLLLVRWVTGIARLCWGGTRRDLVVGCAGLVIAATTLSLWLGELITLRVLRSILDEQRLGMVWDASRMVINIDLRYLSTTAVIALVVAFPLVAAAISTSTRGDAPEEDARRIRWVPAVGAGVVVGLVFAVVLWARYGAGFGDLGGARTRFDDAGKMGIVAHAGLALGVAILARRRWAEYEAFLATFAAGLMMSGAMWMHVASLDVRPEAKSLLLRRSIGLLLNEGSLLGLLVGLVVAGLVKALTSRRADTPDPVAASSSV